MLHSRWGGFDSSGVAWMLISSRFGVKRLCFDSHALSRASIASQLGWGVISLMTVPLRTNEMPWSLLVSIMTVSATGLDTG